MIETINKLIANNSWFDANYKAGLSLGKRFHTMKAALTLLLVRNGRTIVETGCQRQKDDWGAGCSTKVFSEFILHYGLHKLYSIDNNQANIDLARTLTNSKATKFICSDSVEALTEFTRPIDLLYLDSYDYPDGELVKDFMGPLTDYALAMKILKGWPNYKILATYGETLYPCQNHQVKELEAAYDRLHENSIILLDDFDLPGGGKCRLSHEWLRDHYYTPILISYQSLWTGPQ